ncbi:replication-relaxation family protein [Microbacterium capsulatum]|uniref:Replication-relaxation family protein n=1 Tax=Microbacterium capsulatum TaxID=3041921 RepID=A0ABU0XHZ9_9MICO|nr:replication-relaxation family protein [Microbacterium sp. ASV81]MDQ4214765.1 replication-relaxation family protein [Microbacterium sp. ASV81]
MTALRTKDLSGHLTDRDIRILEDLENHRLLTTRQVQRLHFPAQPLGPHTTTSSGTRGTTRVLTRLEGLGTIRRLARRIGGTKHGSSVTIWQLGASGERFLRQRAGRATRKYYEEPRLPFIEHTLAVADVAVALIEQANASHFELLDLQPEPSCWRTFTGPGGTVTSLNPDLFVVTADPSTETHSFVEVDCETEHGPDIRRKCSTYQQYFHTGAEQQARGLFPAVVWIVPTTRRANALQDVIRGDQTLNPSLFWVITTEQTLGQLAPYGASTT